MLGTLNVESNTREGDLDARDVEMSKKVRRSYSRLETLGSASTSTPGRQSCFGSEGLLGAGDLAGVSPVMCSKLPEAPKVPEKTWAPDTTLPGISPPVVKEKRKKKKVPEILVSEGQGPSSAIMPGTLGDMGPTLGQGSAPAVAGERQHLRGMGRDAAANMPLPHSLAIHFSSPRNQSWISGLRP